MHTPIRCFPSLWRATVGTLLALLVSASVLATPLSSQDAKAVREVIHAQLDAFAADDAEKPFRTPRRVCANR